ncbi:hypothetical protein FHT32_001267 [Variovorax sp. SG517]|uniref:hypothetical protein n=1 Tax=Variovorax sp. SG517 TaxID=2587117 RepID=UPI00159DF7B2|nr:hypothetical protein [Variovorax sp. SG517]NVM87628.1 hypothetical protein [Variovorax sp. SG517]
MSDSYLRNLHLELVQGDDYLAADGRALQFVGAGVCWPAAVTDVLLSVWNPVADCGLVGNGSAPLAVVSVAGVFTPAGTSAAIVAVDLPRAETLKLSAGVRRYTFEVVGKPPSNSMRTLARGFVTVLASQS